MVNRQQLATACEHLFRRAGATTAQSGVYAELRDDLRTLLSSGVDLSEGELPIVASVVDDKHWLVTTTDRVAFCTGGETRSFPFSQVDAVHSIALEDGNDTREDVIVLIVDGQRHEVQVEAGYPLGGVWNVLRRVQQAWRKSGG